MFAKIQFYVMSGLAFIIAFLAICLNRKNFQLHSLRENINEKRAKAAEAVADAIQVSDAKSDADLDELFKCQVID